jgi:hypothetical protein
LIKNIAAAFANSVAEFE